MKKIFFLLCMFPTALPLQYIETERTVWRPWTIADSQQWENIELLDSSVAHFYRNDFLETMDELLQRDSHWLTLCNKIQSSISAMMIFPHLGFAVMDKINHELIGTVRIKLCNTPGQLSFGFGLRPDMRNQQLGKEILQQLIHLINQSFGAPIARFKPDITKQAFMKEWYYQGKKTEPDFDHLLSFFHTESYPFETLIGSVDVMNPASLAVLLRNNMEPFSIVCDKYIIDENTSFFSYDFLLRYPAEQHDAKPQLENLVADMLSRNPERINNALQLIHEHFTIPAHCKYLHLNRAEKALLNPREKIASTMSFADSDTIKRIISQSYYPPCCFIKLFQ